ncbi:MAG: bifunctional DNA primase/polymerase [Planctomycetaceae bacterium]|nr:bifunctional DNA primase/polymerase [Planctomycetaceae bacterium]
MTNNTHDLLAAALRLASLCFPVFPCRPGEKRPLTPNGFRDATTDTQQIEEWWSAHPDANLAISTAGLLVVDRDGPENLWPGPGRETDLSEAPTATTPRGGRHWFFRPPEGVVLRCTSSRLAPQVDTRADGGYVVVAPSRITDVGEYEWAPGRELIVPADRLPIVPQWVLEDLDRPRVHIEFLSPTRTDDSSIPAGSRNDTLTRVAGGLRRQGLSADAMQAALRVINQERCRPPLDVQEVDRIAVSVSRYQPDQATVAMIERMIDRPHGSDEPPDDLAGPASVVVPSDPGPMPPGLLRVPGLINQVVDYTLATAPYPDPVLALAGALSLMAVLAGRRVRDEMESRTNLYVLGLAGSGAGKDHPRRINQRILVEIGAAGRLGNAFASGEGIEDWLLEQPAVLFQIDELDGLLRRATQARDSRHEQIFSILLQMYSAASSHYVMRARAGRPRQVIEQPCFCIFGTAVPSQFFSSISTALLTNGFLARMVILTSGSRGRGQEPMSQPIPPGILEVARWWITQEPDPEADANPRHVPRLVEASPEALQVFRAFREAAEQEYAAAERRDDQAGMAIWARAHEKARRLALIYAASADHLEPRIDLPAAQWACQFIEQQTRQMLAMAAIHTSENSFDGQRKRFLDVLTAWRLKNGDAWMPAWKLRRQLSSWSTTALEEVAATLIGQRLIESDARSTGGRPGVFFRLSAGG